MIDVLRFPTHNIYSYDSRNLVISYSIAILFTAACACIGIFAIQHNGVAHSTAFSAIVATTRSHELDTVSIGHSLGALPLKHTKMKVRFGEITGTREKDKGGIYDKSVTGTHIGFGAAENVSSLKKGKKYV
jgi:hypothetical protein